MERDHRVQSPRDRNGLPTHPQGYSAEHDLKVIPHERDSGNVEPTNLLIFAVLFREPPSSSAPDPFSSVSYTICRRY